MTRGGGGITAVREVTPLTVVMTELVDMVDYGRQRL
jgi:hypothetical protein